MNITESPFTITISGIIAVAILSILGAILSRLLKFNYSVFSLLSLGVYIGVAWLVAQKTGLMGALSSSIAVGIFDAIIGWELCRLFKANLGEMQDELEKISVHTRATGMILFSALFGLIGYWLA
jgi:hypothetical protein